MTTGKRVVLDANILIRAVLGTKVRQIIEQFYESAQFFTPEVCFNDARKYLPPLFAKRDLPVDDALIVLEKLTCFVQSINYNLYQMYELEAKQRIAKRDINDWPIVATALLLDCPIWTEDVDFFGVGIATWTSDRIHLYLK